MEIIIVARTHVPIYWDERENYIFFHLMFIMFLTVIHAWACEAVLVSVVLSEPSELLCQGRTHGRRIKLPSIYLHIKILL